MLLVAVLYIHKDTCGGYKENTNNHGYSIDRLWNQYINETPSRREKACEVKQLNKDLKGFKPALVVRRICQ